LLGREESTPPTCWYEQKGGTLLVTLGGECVPHRRAVFERVGGSWTLTNEEAVPLVLCHERVR
jgi:hypothetical protein